MEPAVIFVIKLDSLFYDLLQKGLLKL